MSNDTTQHTPADVRERIKAAIREGVRYVAKADGAYLYEPSVDETADRILSLLRTPRGEGEAKFDVGDPVALRLAASKLEASGYDVLALRLRKIADQIKCVIAARRSKAHGEDRWEDVVFGPITEAYNEAHAARRGEGGGK